MTVVAGFMNGDSIIIASDSREVANDYSKSSIQKIHETMFYKNWRMAIAGAANDSVYLKLFENELMTKLAPIQGFEFGKIVSIIKATLHQIHKQHLWPRRDARPSFDSIIALQPMNPPPFGRGLFMTHDSAVIPVKEFASIGIGSHMADYIKGLIYPNDGDIYNASTNQVATFAAYMLQQIKRSVHGVDGETAVMVLKGDGTVQWLNRQEIVNAEIISNVFYAFQLPIFKSLLDSETTPEALNQALQNFISQVQAIKQAQAQTRK